MRAGSPSETLRNHHRTQYVHRRDPDDNESALCGNNEGAASLDPREVTCPHPLCRFHKEER